SSVVILDKISRYPSLSSCMPASPVNNRSRQDSVLQRFYSFLFPSYPLMTIPFIKPDLEVHIATGPVRVFRTRSSPFAARRATTKRG
ncbi:TPA: hypothetical protein ACQQQB_001452, partial [Pseudomonas aeruginosa]